MAPYVNPDRQRAHQESHPYASTSTSEDSRRSSRPGKTNGANSERMGSMPGAIPTGSMSKLKAQLRQTTRLLAKDNLTPDVRITSERRLKSLKLELIKTEQSQLEQKMVTKYRGIKFFERQKILRKIKQAKKSLIATPDDSSLSIALLESRIDLYYILKYPKTEKYVSLFPEGTYVAHSASNTTPDAAAKTKGDAEGVRNGLRNRMRMMMQNGELSAEPEGGDLGIEGEEDVVSQPEAAVVEAMEVDEEKLVEEQPIVEKKVKKVKIAAEPEAIVEAEVVAPVIDVAKRKREKKERKLAKKEKKGLGETIAPEGKAIVEGWAGDEFFA